MPASLKRACVAEMLRAYIRRSLYAITSSTYTLPLPGSPPATVYVEEVWKLHQDHALESRFPEWILQQVDQEWIAEVPNANEAGLYKISCPYAKWLLDHTEDKQGKNLEYLVQYLIGAMPGCRALRRVRSEVSDYDVVGV